MLYYLYIFLILDFLNTCSVFIDSWAYRLFRFSLGRYGLMQKGLN